MQTPVYTAIFVIQGAYTSNGRSKRGEKEGRGKVKQENG